MFSRLSEADHGSQFLRHHAVNRPCHVSFLCQVCLRRFCSCLMSNRLAQKTHCEVLQLDLYLRMQIWSCTESDGKDIIEMKDVIATNRLITSYWDLTPAWTLHAHCKNLRQSTDASFVDQLQKNECSFLEALPVPAGNRPVSRQPDTGGQAIWPFF